MKSNKVQAPETAENDQKGKLLRKWTYKLNVYRMSGVTSNLVQVYDKAIQLSMMTLNQHKPSLIFWLLPSFSVFVCKFNN